MKHSILSILILCSSLIIVSADSEHKPYLLEQVLDLHNNGNTSQAFNLIDSSAEQAPASVRPLICRAYMLAATEKPNDAKTAWQNAEKLLENADDEDQAHFWAARYYFLFKCDPNSTKEECIDARTSFGQFKCAQNLEAITDPSCLFAHAHTAWAAKDLDLAAKSFQKLIASKPSTPNNTADRARTISHYTSLGHLLILQKNYPEAIEELRKGVALKETDSNIKEFQVYDSLGTALRKSKQHLEAIEAYRKAKVANPNNVQVNSNLARSLISADAEKKPETFKAAIDLIEEGLKQSSNHYELNYHLAKIYRMLACKHMQIAAGAPQNSSIIPKDHVVTLLERLQQK